MAAERTAQGQHATVLMTDSLRPLPTGARAIGRRGSGRWLELTLALRRRTPLPDLGALDRLLPAARRYLTRETLARAHGPAPEAIRAVQAFAARHGLVVGTLQPAAARLRLGGPVGAMEAAFGVTLIDYAHDALGRFHATPAPATVPAEMAAAVSGVFGFSTLPALRRAPHRRVLAPGREAQPASGRAWFVPGELASLYDFPAGDASGQCLGLLEFGGGVDQQDVAAYFQQIGTPPPAIAIVPVDGAETDPSSDPNATGEVMLDVEVAGALAPGARLAVYFSSFDEKGMIDILAAVVEDRANDPSVLSISWGWDENEPIGNLPAPWSRAAIAHCDESFLAAAHLGITTCVATGDDGAEAQIKDGRAHVVYPATSPYVLAVGGTSLRARAEGGAPVRVSETVWNDGPGSGTGGGISEITPVPAWQEGIVPASINPGGFRGRGIPDVAADADPATGYLARSGGQFQIVGGTSAAAPLWASLIARINTALAARAGNLNALLYGTIGPAGALRDITSGDNDTEGLLGGQYRAGPGWDACSGWGTPGGTALLEALRGPTS